jgi:hypothetical protein
MPKRLSEPLLDPVQNARRGGLARVAGAGMRIVLGLALVVAPLAGIAAAQEQFAGTITIVRSVVGASMRGSFTIHIQSYTSAEESQELLRLLSGQGAQALQERLLDLDRARFQVPGRASVNMGYVGPLCGSLRESAAISVDEKGNLRFDNVVPPDEITGVEAR